MSQKKKGDDGRDGGGSRRCDWTSFMFALLFIFDYFVSHFGGIFVSRFGIPNDQQHHATTPPQASKTASAGPLVKVFPPALGGETGRTQSVFSPDFCWLSDTTSSSNGADESSLLVGQCLDAATLSPFAQTSGLVSSVEECLDRLTSLAENSHIHLLNQRNSSYYQWNSHLVPEFDHDAQYHALIQFEEYLVSSPTETVESVSRTNEYERAFQGYTAAGDLHIHLLNQRNSSYSRWYGHLVPVFDHDAAAVEAIRSERASQENEGYTAAGISHIDLLNQRNSSFYQWYSHLVPVFDHEAAAERSATSWWRPTSWRRPTWWRPTSWRRPTSWWRPTSWSSRDNVDTGSSPVYTGDSLASTSARYVSASAPSSVSSDVPNQSLELKCVIGETVMNIQVSSNHSIREIKKTVGQFMNATTAERFVFFNNFVLDESSTLSHYHVASGDTLYFPLDETMQVFVKPPGEKTMTLTVTPTTSIASLKHTISENTNNDIDYIRLSYGGKELRDTHKIAEYGIEGESTLTFLQGCLRGGSGREVIEVKDDSDDDCEVIEMIDLSNDNRSSSSTTNALAARCAKASVGLTGGKTFPARVSLVSSTSHSLFTCSSLSFCHTLSHHLFGSRIPTRSNHGHGRLRQNTAHKSRRR